MKGNSRAGRSVVAGQVSWMGSKKFAEFACGQLGLSRLGTKEEMLC